MEIVATVLNQIAAKMKKILQFTIVLFLLSACNTNTSKPKVTSIELGSVRCIPCQKMQKVIKKVEEKYPTEVKTIFYDVWTDEGKKASKDYEFDEIPTQIFLDKNGKEFARHVGFFSYEDLEKILKQKLK